MFNEGIGIMAPSGGNNNLNYGIRLNFRNVKTDSFQAKMKSLLSESALNSVISGKALKTHSHAGFSLKTKTENRNPV